MGILLYLSLVASHEPGHWTIKCDGWRDIATEVRQDEYLDEQSKLDLIDYGKGTIKPALWGYNNPKTKTKKRK